MKKSVSISLMAFVIFSLLLTGCNLPSKKPAETQVELLNTAAAQTVQAQQTSIAVTVQAQQTSNAQVTATPTEVLEQNTATIPVPTDTQVPTALPSFTSTAVFTSTPQTRCDQAAFVSETIPDGSIATPGQTFTKTWTLKNSGSCTWDSNYHVVFFSGNAMGAPAAKQLTTDKVAPGETVTISIDLQAPTTAGVHRGDFKLRNAGGVIFAIGPNDSPFWAEIKVEAFTPGKTFDFATNYCNLGVKWTNASGDLPCPGKSGDNNGWVKLIKEPLLENMALDDEPGLQVHPQKVTNGWIRGTYPEMVLSENTVFKTIIGCYGDANCDVRFYLLGKVDGGPEQLIGGGWHEVQDRKFKRIEIDLSSFTGKRIQFVLMVEAAGNTTTNESLWFAPRIEPK